jgi:hypothetical protein
VHTYNARTSCVQTSVLVGWAADIVGVTLSAGAEPVGAIWSKHRSKYTAGGILSIFSRYRAGHPRLVVVSQPLDAGLYTTHLWLNICLLLRSLLLTDNVGGRVRLMKMLSS